ncbi:hypothetical protein D6R99_07285 [Salmonella enterica subsp. enterica]|nr:hypothetical protein [Salmonella enterica subsp. enterica serovar Enteritidis]ECG1798488.1 hypothetical protein [Salmonella enterica subsp. enterica serovar Paratyphi B]EDD7888867.1 hypothetical protein [Salmonella enterica subsp. enterica serovar Enteritidis]
MADLTAERVVGIDVILTTAWTTLILDDDERDYHLFTRYQRHVLLKDILHGLFPNYLQNYNEWGAIDMDFTHRLVCSYIREAKMDLSRLIGLELMRAMRGCMGIEKGYRFYYRIDGKLLRYYPRRSRRYDG